MSSPSGNPFADKYPSPKEVTDFHHNDDLDKSDVAHHHTLGLSQNQAASGKHNHRDGNGQPLLDDFTFTGSRSTNTVSVMTQMIAALVALGATDATSA